MAKLSQSEVEHIGQASYRAGDLLVELERAIKELDAGKGRDGSWFLSQERRGAIQDHIGRLAYELSMAGFQVTT